MADLRRETDEAFESEIEPGEKILWQGRPDATRAGLKLVPVLVFAIPWLAFSIFWVVGAADYKVPDLSKPGGFFPLFGLPFVLVGLFLLSVPYLGYRTAQRTVYAVTSKRVLILILGRTRKTTSYYPKDVKALEVTVRSNGKGDVVFAREIWRGRRGSTNTTPIGFFGIDDPEAVKRLMAHLKTGDAS
jgi:hypothetical protein